MTRASDQAPVRGLLLDIEGTTTPVAFVYETLFPYARARVSSFIEAHRDDPLLQSDLTALRAEHTADERRGSATPAWEAEGELDSAARYALWLMDHDRKTAGLKSLQGRIWEAGYRSGDLRGQVYPDVPVALARWQHAGKGVWIFSSGSVLAQRLLFGDTAAGDLTNSIRGYFDTSSGAKTEAASFARIAAATGLPAEALLFVSDVARELDAAREAGLQTALCVRQPGAAPSAATHPVIHDFDALD